MTEERQNALVTLFSQVPPHEVLTFALVKFARKNTAEIAENLFDTPLGKLQEELEEARKTFQPPPGIIDACLALLRSDRGRTLAEVVEHRAVPWHYPDLLDQTVGETTFRTYAIGLGEEAKDNVERWQYTVYNHLKASCEAQVRGYIRARARNDADAEDIEQETWTKVWTNISSYHVGRAAFSTYVKMWAKSTAIDYYRKKENKKDVVILLAELSRYYPDAEQEKEIADIIIRSNAYLSDTLDEVEHHVDQAQCYKELLRITFSSASPPHQLMAFGFVKLLEWAPREMVAEHSDHLLRRLEHELEDEYLAIAHFPEATFRTYLEPLRENLERRFGTLAPHPKTREIYADLLDRITGDTALKEYYTSDPPDNIVKWWHAVRVRVVNEVVRQGRGFVFEYLQE